MAGGQSGLELVAGGVQGRGAAGGERAGGVVVGAGVAGMAGS
ncbi:hypothetical protein OIM90_10750 [Streptomyces sp. AD16]|nr:hypothetical protein NQP46_21570 [Streptomyces albus]WDV31625.1 hypothetical protein OIM90_10750 [Streptomyces sp. AD16]